MIIRWTHDDGFPATMVDDRLAEVARELLRAHRRGHHLAVMDRDVARAIGSMDLSNKDKSLASRLGQEFTQTRNVHNSSKVYIEIINSFEKIVNVSDCCVKVSLGAAVESKIFDPCALIVEDISSDGWLFELIFNTVSKRSSARKFDYELIHGGGQNANHVVKNTLKNRRITVAIIDSDKSSPLCSTEKKEKAFSELYKASGWGIGKTFLTPCRELENFVPNDILRILPSGILNKANEYYLNISSAEEAGGVKASDKLEMYADFKSGIQMLPCKLNKDAASWMSERLKLACLDETLNIPGYGEKVIDQIKADGSLISEFVAAIRSKSWQDKFSSFFEEVLWYFVSNGPLRT
ncbi:hypothetical protein SAMN05880590_12723 [Rhizobium sp. RU35A]|uniref:hypothetical protein n=1 Tax=Rhizobium sp. RU35A TaxID=1907414 RepID=UPI000955E666|nr:hypothetical protein [Rhizobium sp. RU35A]SIR41522.1 hypothetical protein SAMN05880590_12723 [Rhizobium sp. RU35A]